MITATQHIRKMRGGSQSHLMFGSDGHAYVVKFQNNPQHLRVLANEFLATKLAQSVGLNVPEVEIVDVSQWLIKSTRELVVENDKGQKSCTAGFQFGSRLVGDLLPGHTMDYLPERWLSEVVNKYEFAGILAFDKWTSNADGRQAVFHKRVRDERYLATFIDQGSCFEGGKWTFFDAPLRGAYGRREVYREVAGWDDFEPWLGRVEKMDPQEAWYIAKSIPEEWFGGPPVELDILLDQLFKRRGFVRDLIAQFRDTSPSHFPNWTSAYGKKMAGGQAKVICWKPVLGVP